MKPRRRTTTMSEILESVLPGMDSSRRAQLLLPHAWKQAVGQAIAYRTSPRSIVNGVLQVAVANSVWVQELYFMKESIIAKLHKQLPHAHIDDIRFRVGHVPAAPGPDAASLPELSEQEQNVIRSQAACIQDEELRMALEAAMTSYQKNRRKQTRP